MARTGEFPIRGKRFLIIRLGAIGDVLRVLPAVRRLRRVIPDATIGWAVEQWVYPVVAGNPNLDRFHVLDRRELGASPSRALRESRRFVTELRSQRYQVVLDFHGRLKSGVVSRLSGAGHRIGYARGDETEANYLFNNIHVALEDRWENRVCRFLRLLGPLGVEVDYDPNDLGLYIDAEVRRGADAWYRAAGKPALAVFPGTSRVRSGQRWPGEKWVDLLSRLGRRGVSSVVFWGPEEQELAAEICAEAGSACTLAPPTTLPEMMGMIGCFEAFIGSDTAAMHMAWLQGIPTAVFTGPKPQRTVAPLAPNVSRALCASHFEIPGLPPSKQPGELVTEVAVGEAFEAVEYLLAKGRNAAGQSSGAK